MNTPSLSSSQVQTSGRRPWLQRIADFLRPGPDQATVNALADDILRAPLLQAWLLTAAGRPRRARRELLARAARALAREVHDALLHDILRKMSKPRLHDAVVDEIFRRWMRGA